MIVLPIHQHHSHLMLTVIKGFKMSIGKLLGCCLLLLTSNLAVAVDAKYCYLLQQIRPGMEISDVFMILGPPQTFGQPPNLDTRSLSRAMPPEQPGTMTNTTASATDQKAQAKQLMQSDPILSSFINAKSDSTNVLIWQFENNTLSISVKTKGPLVTDVKANYPCVQ